MFEGLSSVERAKKRDEICEKLGLNNRQTLRQVVANPGNDYSHEVQTLMMLGSLLERVEALEGKLNDVHQSRGAGKSKLARVPAEGEKVSG